MTDLITAEEKEHLEQLSALIKSTPDGIKDQTVGEFAYLLGLIHRILERAGQGDF